MHNIILKIFGFLKSCTQFLKIVLLFCILMLILYWIQNLTGDTWAWTVFMNRFLDSFLELGYRIAPGSIMLFAAVFEFKFLVALLMFGGLYALVHLMFRGLETLESLYDDGRRMVKKMEEDSFNRQMAKLNTNEQKKIKRYQIYVEAQVKPKFALREYNIDLEEQNQIMLKFLIEKTNNCPEKHENGYLFTFNSFSQIDDILDIFSKLPESKAPLDYIICVQIIGQDNRKEISQMKTLIELKTLNKITSLADTAFRYGYNDLCRYNVIQAGLFQKNGESFELHEFVKKD